jgi:eukaryotic-like serine/threonine-protein kinase
MAELTRRQVLGGAGAAVALAVAGPTRAGAADDPVPAWDLGEDSASTKTMLMFRGNPSRTFYGTGPLPDSPRLKWQIAMRGVAASDGRVWEGTGWSGQPVKWGPRIYVGSQNFKMYALDSETGAVEWTYPGGRMFKSSACFFKGRLYEGNVDNNLHCVDAKTGKRVWAFATPNDLDSSPCVADGRLYFGGECGYMHCLDPISGKLIWKSFLGGLEGPPGSNGVESSPTVADGRVWAANFSGELYCLDAKTGKTIWKARTGGDTDASAVAAGEFVYAAAEEENPKLLCFAKEDGKEVWSFGNRAGFWSTPAVVGDRLYIGGQNDKLYCLDAKTGKELWSFATQAPVWSSPAVVDGKVLFGSYDSNLYLLDAATGKKIWSYQTSARVLSTPCVVDGTFWVGNSGGSFHCFSP